MCGVAIKFGRPISGEFFGGSTANVSTAAPASLTRAKRFGERSFVDQFSARAVNQARAALHFRKRSCVDHFFGDGAERRVEGDYVAAAQEFVERHELDFEFARGGGRDVGVVRQDLHFEGARAAGNFRANAAESDEAQRFSAQLSSRRGRFFPSAGVNRGIRLRHGAREGQHEREGVFRDADAVSAGRVHHQDAAMRGRFDVDIVDSDAGAADHAKALGFFEQLSRDAGGAADDQAVGIREFARQGCGGGRNNFPACFAEQLKPAVTYFVGDDNFHGNERSGRTSRCQMHGGKEVRSRRGLRYKLRVRAACAILLRRESDEMGYIERIQSDLTAAMKEKDELRLSVLRMMKSALKNKEIEKVRPLDDLESLQVLQTMVKQRRESIDQFTKGGRKDLAEKEAKEIAIIEDYLPAAPSDEEVHQAIEAAIAEAGADSLKQMGAVIKAARATVGRQERRRESAERPGAGATDEVDGPSRTRRAKKLTTEGTEKSQRAQRRTARCKDSVGPRSRDAR